MFVTSNIYIKLSNFTIKAEGEKNPKFRTVFLNKRVKPFTINKYYQL